MGQWWKTLFETLVGPLVVAAIITTMGLGFTAWGRLVELEFELARHRDSYSVLLDRFERGQRDFAEFKGKGDRYSTADADRDRAAFASALSTLQSRMETLAQRGDGSRAAISRMEVKVEHLERNQQRQHP